MQDERFADMALFGLVLAEEGTQVGVSWLLDAATTP